MGTLILLSTLSLVFAAIVGWGNTLEYKLIQYWAVRPWRVFWLSYLILIPAALLYDILQTTAMLLSVVSVAAIYASAIHGLRITWARSPKRALWVVGGSFSLLVLNALARASRTGDIKLLDSMIAGTILLIPLWVAAVWIAHRTALRFGQNLSELASANRANKRNDNSATVSLASRRQ
jgi:hypothetical protein